MENDDEIDRIAKIVAERLREHIAREAADELMRAYCTHGTIRATYRPDKGVVVEEITPENAGDIFSETPTTPQSDSGEGE